MQKSSDGRCCMGDQGALAVRRMEGLNDVWRGPASA